MGFAKEITKFHYKGLKGPWGVLFGILLFLPLLFASIFYFIAIYCKNLLYKIGILSETCVGNSQEGHERAFEGKETGARVICIGNLTTGGVGKTPVTIEFCKFLSKKYKVSSLSRGYKGKLKGANIIRDFEKILIDDPKLTGDEVQLISKESTGYAVIVSSDRVLGANKAIDELGAQIIIMDDGFSNRKIKKDLSLLLFDVNKFVGNGAVLPFGPLREPLSEIKRADGVILIDKEGQGAENSAFRTSKKESLKEFIELKFKKPVFFADFKPDSFYNIKTGENVDKAEISYAFAFSGIGQPDLFYNYLLAELDGFNSSAVMSFDDHHAYTKEDIQNIESAAKKRGAECLVTTEKDAVKIAEFIEDVTLPVLALKLKADVDVEYILSELNFGEKSEA